VETPGVPREPGVPTSHARGYPDGLLRIGGVNWTLPHPRHAPSAGRAEHDTQKGRRVGVVQSRCGMMPCSTRRRAVSREWHEWHRACRLERAQKGPPSSGSTTWWVSVVRCPHGPPTPGQKRSSEQTCRLSRCQRTVPRRGSTRDRPARASVRARVSARCLGQRPGRGRSAGQPGAGQRCDGTISRAGTSRGRRTSPSRPARRRSAGLGR
jgi:hypothetical protein